MGSARVSPVDSLSFLYRPLFGHWVSTSRPAPRQFREMLLRWPKLTDRRPITS
jgi:hypothetical protein